STVLLFLLLVKMTARMGPSLFVAAVFGLHPLHVESVAWAAERKDVLSGFFFIVTLWCYVAYVRRAAVWRLLLFMLAFALARLSNPMVVTLPFVLLLLDYWPLRRTDRPIRLIVEKLPLFVLAAGSSVITFIAQSRGGAVVSTARYPLSS